MHTTTFDFPFVAACISIIGAVVLLVATRQLEERKRLSIILLCAGFLVSGIWHLAGLKGEDGALMQGASLGFTASALVVVLWGRHVGLGRP